MIGIIIPKNTLTVNIKTISFLVRIVAYHTLVIKRSAHKIEIGFCIEFTKIIVVPIIAIIFNLLFSSKSRDATVWLFFIQVPPSYQNYSTGSVAFTGLLKK
jgi:hypothetical protein